MSFGAVFGAPNGWKKSCFFPEIGKLARAKIFKNGFEKGTIFWMVFWSSEGVQKASKIDGIFEKIG